VLVYGAAQDTHKAEFLAELARMSDSGSIPSLICGDFNILRKKEDKNNDNFKPHWPFVFNAITESLNLREIAL
jgi:exonuclease III